MVKNAFKTALKFFWRNRTYNFINLLGLSVSVSCILIILSYISNEQQYDSDIQNRDRIYRIGTDWACVPSFIGHFLKNESDYIENVTRVKMEVHDVNFDNKAFRLENLGMADPNFFDVFNFKFLLGNPAYALKTKHSIVLTRSESKRIFNDVDPINQVILFRNKYPFKVTGVIEDPEYFHLPLKAIATLESLKELAYNEILEQKDGWDYFTYVISKPSLSAEDTEEKINKKLKEYNYQEFHLTDLENLYFAPPLYYEGNTRHGSRTVLYILFSIAVMLFVLAIINCINLTHARSYTRIREIGIKKLIGGRMSILWLQFMFESVFIILIAAFFSLFLVKLVEPFFNNLIQKQIDFTMLFAPERIIILVLCAICTGILAGSIPTFALIRAKPSSLLKNSNDIDHRTSAIGKPLVVFQYFVSILLIAGTLMILKQLHSLKSKDLGFSPEQIVCVEINEDIKAQQNAFKAELLKVSGVIEAAYSGNSMGHDWSNWINEIDGEGKSFKVNSVEPGYFKLMGITMIEGRAFRDDDVDRCYIINETAVKKYNLNNPLEKVMYRDNKPYPIIGVMKDFNFQSPQYPIEPVLLNFRDKKFNLINLKIDAGNTKEVLKRIEKIWNTFCPDNVLRYTFMDELYNRQYKSTEQFSTLVGIGGGIAVLIACLGIFGLSISSSEQRTKEIGIRKVNGARVSEILVMLNKSFVKWVAIAYLIACPIAWFGMHKWLQNFAYKTTLSWWVFAVAGAAAMAIALLTVSWQSWRAATRNPVETLRYE